MKVDKACMSQAKLREALSAGASSRDKGPPVADGVLTATSDSAEGGEWRSRRSVIDAIASKSSYLDEPGDFTECRSSLYGRFTWRLDKFSEVTKRELRSSSFQVGPYKWYILVYPQGCDVANHLSLFLCVANYDKLLPGWSHFAQFTIAVMNKDPKKSKYSDTLHRFCKKEHDWGWKKFMDLGKLADGFTVADSLVIKAQVQVIPDCPPRPVCMLDSRYRKELVRVYLSNVEGIVRRFLEEKKALLNRLVGPQALEGFSAFWNDLEENKRVSLLSAPAPMVFKSLVKRFFNEKEVTSTLMVDSLYSGAKELELGFRERQQEEGSGSGQGQEGRGGPQPVVVVIDAQTNRFLFVDSNNAMGTLKKMYSNELLLPLPFNDPPPPRADPVCADEDRSISQANDETGTRESMDHDECRLAHLGRVTLEVYAACFIAETQLEPAWVEAEIIKRQEALIREEEEAERGEAQRAAAKAEAEKERRARKKERQRLKKEVERAKREAEEAERLKQEEQKRAEAERRRAESEEKAAEKRLQTALKEAEKHTGTTKMLLKPNGKSTESDDGSADPNGNARVSNGALSNNKTSRKASSHILEEKSNGSNSLFNSMASSAVASSSSQLEFEEPVPTSLLEKLSLLKSECEEKDRIIAQLCARIDELEGLKRGSGVDLTLPGGAPENGRMFPDATMRVGQPEDGETVNRSGLPRQSSAPGLAQRTSGMPMVHQPQFPPASVMIPCPAGTSAGLAAGHSGHVYPPLQQVYHAANGPNQIAPGSRSSSSSNSLLIGVVGDDAVPASRVQIPPISNRQSASPTMGSRTFSSPLPDSNKNKPCQSNGIAVDSSGLDDFAHMGLITDLLE